MIANFKSLRDYQSFDLSIAKYDRSIGSLDLSITELKIPPIAKIKILLIAEIKIPSITRFVDCKIRGSRKRIPLIAELQNSVDHKDKNSIDCKDKNSVDHEIPKFH